jgi:hypothetical protein
LEINNKSYVVLGEIFYLRQHFFSRLFFQNKKMIYGGQKNGGIPFQELSSEPVIGFKEFLIYFQIANSTSNFL